MSVPIIGIITLLFGGVCFLLGEGWAIAAVLIFYVFGSASALSIGALALIPINVLIPIAIASAVLRGFFTKRVISFLMFPKPGFWLAILLFYAFYSALFNPRLLGQITSVNPIGTTNFEVSLVPTPLSPTSGNVSQSIYLASSIAFFFVVYRYCCNRGRILWIIKSFMFFSILNILFAFLDILTFYTGTANALSFIRNANYTLHIDETMAGLKRIAGAQPEASTFAGLTLCNVAISTKLLSGNVYKRKNLLLVVVQVLLLVASTSSTAYIGILFLSLIYLIPSRSTFSNAEDLRSWAFSVTVLLGIGTLMTAVIFSVPAVYQTANDLINASLVDKMSSDSGIERSALNAQCITNFFETYGFGVGMGSARSSSWAFSVVANLGLVGLICYLVFLIALFRPISRTSEQLFWVHEASRMGCLMMLVSQLTSGTNADLGPFFYIWAGVAFACKDRISIANPMRS
ncbi:hypothetical protein ACLBXB_28520 [Methylobacterium mesophilicum]